MKFLLKIVENNWFLSRYEINQNLIAILDFLPKEYLNLHVSVFPNETLKPKHNFLLHYKTILVNSGPLSRISCLRFEGKHREFKKNSNNVQSRQNIPLTLSKKFQLKFACRVLSGVVLDDRIANSKPILQPIDFKFFYFYEQVHADFFNNECY